MKTVISKGHDALVVAKYLTEKYDIMSSVKLQKILYFTYIEYLQKTGKKLFEDDFEAWIYGPVIRNVFVFVKRNGLNFKYKRSDFLTEDEKNIIDIIANNYINYDPDELIWLTHQTNPWIKSRKGFKSNEISEEKISYTDLKSYAQKYKREKITKNINWS